MKTILLTFTFYLWYFVFPLPLEVQIHLKALIGDHWDSSVGQKWASTLIFCNDLFEKNIFFSWLFIFFFSLLGIYCREENHPMKESLSTSLHNVKQKMALLDVALDYTLGEKGKDNQKWAELFWFLGIQSAILLALFSEAFF